MAHTEEQKFEFIDLYIANGCNIKITCEAFGIHRRTYYLWREENWFEKAMYHAKKNRNDIVESSLFKNALEGNVTAQIFWLKKKEKKEWGDEKEVPEQIVYNVSVSKEEAREISKALEDEY